MSFICHIHNYTEYNQLCIRALIVFSAFNPSKCTHTWSSGQPTLQRPGSSWGFGALLKGLTSVVDNSCRSWDSNPQPPGTSPTLYPLEPRLPSFYVFLEMVRNEMEGEMFKLHYICCHDIHWAYDVWRNQVTFTTNVSFFDIVVINYLAICSAYPRLLGGPTQNGRGWGGDCWRVWLRWKNGFHVFHSVSDHARGKVLISSVAPYAFNCFFCFSSKRLYDIYIT